MLKFVLNGLLFQQIVNSVSRYCTLSGNPFFFVIFLLKHNFIRKYKINIHMLMHIYSVLFFNETCLLIVLEMFLVLFIILLISINHRVNNLMFDLAGFAYWSSTRAATLWTATVCGVFSAWCLTSWTSKVSLRYL